MTIAEKLTAIAENEPEVYDAGKKAEYDRFWDDFQQNGNRTDYNSAFRSAGWTADNFKPKYDIVPVGNSNSVFVTSGINADLVEILEKQGVVLDFSKVTMLGSGFQGSKFTHMGVIDCSSFTPTGTTSLFHNCTVLKRIDKIIVNENITLTNWFAGCSSLEEIRFEGVIGKNLDLHWSTNLTVDSVEDIIEHLGGTASATLTLPARFKEIDDYLVVIEGKPSNWTVAYL